MPIKLSLFCQELLTNVAFLAPASCYLTGFQFRFSVVVELFQAEEVIGENFDVPFLNLQGSGVNLLIKIYVIVSEVIFLKLQECC